MPKQNPSRCLFFFNEAETSNPMRKSAIGVSLAKSLHEAYFPGWLVFSGAYFWGPNKWPKKKWVGRFFVGFTPIYTIEMKLH